MGKTITRESQSTEQSVDIQKLSKMKFFLLALVLVGTYCFAAGLDEVSDKLSLRMRQRRGLRRITQSRRDAETIYRASNQTRQAGWAWNYDSNKGGPKYCGNGVAWHSGGTGHPRYGGLCVEEGGCRRCAGRQQDTTAGGLQAAWVVRVLVMALGAGSTSAVPQCTHIKNAHQPRPGP